MADKFKKLSQAIRLGATFHPQCITYYRVKDMEGKTIATCALGAAMEALGPRSVGKSNIMERFPEISNNLCDEIIKRNDRLYQTREQIADWLESQGY